MVSCTIFPFTDYWGIGSSSGSCLQDFVGFGTDWWFLGIDSSRADFWRACCTVCVVCVQFLCWLLWVLLAGFGLFFEGYWFDFVVVGGLWRLSVFIARL